MTSPSGDLLSSSWQHIAALGETVTFRDQEYSVPLIQYVASMKPSEQINFEEDAGSVIQLPPDLDEPQCGEHLLDSSGRYHRIIKVHERKNEICWTVTCQVGAPP